ncbi:MAG: 1,4-dihydroxy-2-naphthoate polyprenyltransferase [Anaerolinea sp.]|nr:1,4-dihydroxy-2-naphthoate polyprenyltransferase [Anaerolinea sp.]
MPMSKWKIWWLAARPKTLPAAAAGVVAGTALAWWDGQFAALPALTALLAALLLQVGSNLANDVFDYERGADAQRTAGPLRVTQAGLLRPAQVKLGMVVVFAAAVLLGAYLVWVGGWPIVAIGVTAIVAAIAYTAGPFPLGYHGLGEVFVFLFFGLAAVNGTYYVQAGRLSAAAGWVSVAVGLLIVNILVVNNLRDLETDRAAGKRTLATRIGAQATRRQYMLLFLLALLLPVGCVLAGLLPVGALLTGLCLPLAWPTLRLVWRAEGATLNRALAGSGQLALWFAVLLWVGLALWG